MEKGERIRARREQLGITQTSLADIVGESKQTIYKYENGIISNIPSDKVEAIAKALKVSPAWIFGWENDDSQKIPPGFIPLPPTVKVPLIGKIACGEPILAEENIDDYVEAPADAHIDFALLCKGDSMIDAGICDGDLVYIHIQPQVENGEIAAVRIDGEATLKRVFWNDDTQTLQLLAENRDFPPLVYTGPILNTVHIEGKAVGYTHWF